MPLKYLCLENIVTFKILKYPYIENIYALKLSMPRKIYALKLCPENI